MSATGIAGALDYHPATDFEEPTCFICGGAFKGGSSFAARVQPPMVQVCSAACAAEGGEASTGRGLGRLCGLLGANAGRPGEFPRTTDATTTAEKSVLVEDQRLS
jgi:hypothetical protein